jgi:Rod binding domain-containing protein
MDSINPVADLGFRMLDCGTDVNPQSAIRNPQSNPVEGGEEEKKRIARDFESVLLTKLFDEVKESIGQWGLDEDEEDGASQQVHGLFWLYLAQDVADKGGFGMWQEIYQHFDDIKGANAAGGLIDREL